MLSVNSKKKKNPMPYLSLIKNYNMLGVLLGCPLEERNELLMRMISS